MKIIHPGYIEIAFNVEKTYLKYWNTEASELVPFISELTKNLKKRFKDVKMTELCKKYKRMFAPSAWFLECKVCTANTSTNDIVDQCLRQIVQFEARRHKRSTFFQQVSLWCWWWKLFEIKVC